MQQRPPPREGGLQREGSLPLALAAVQLSGGGAVADDDTQFFGEVIGHTADIQDRAVRRVMQRIDGHFDVITEDMASMDLSSVSVSERLDKLERKYEQLQHKYQAVQRRCHKAEFKLRVAVVARKRMRRNIKAAHALAQCAIARGALVEQANEDLSSRLRALEAKQFGFVVDAPASPASTVTYESDE